MTVLGLGAQDNLAEAEYFFDQFGRFSFPMYWDPTFESWRQLGVSSQPRAALFAADGSFIDAWLGRFPEAKVEALLADQPA